MNPLSRRQFLAASAAGCAGLWGARLFAGNAPVAAPLNNFGADVSALLADWCDGLLRLQFRDESKPEQFGAFRCPACGIIHGRCADASYPLMHLAARTGKREYLDAALRTRAWSRNVDCADGAWQNDPGTTHSWKGITVFGSIALAEALHHHGKLLDAATRDAWTARLRKGIEFVFRGFHWKNYSNINYPVTASYALALCGRVLDEPQYVERGREFARKSLEFFTKPNRLLYGEGKPYELRSPKGCAPVDLGYNVEESLQALAQYGLLTGDEEVLGATVESLKAHLEFMLPDGGWDNSWGTRSYKWTYWGSRTSDGCLPAYALLAAREPTFATAAIRHLALLRSCTKDGLLHGGPGYIARGVPPCVHHTFCHAKALASLLDHPKFVPALAGTSPLPRAAARGIRAFPEIQVWLAATGPWRATVSGYDWFTTRPKMTIRQATGGALGLLWHERVGPVLCASLAEYLPWEPANMQPMTEPDVPLTPRVERIVDGKRVSNLFDGEAEVVPSEEAGALVFRVKMKLLPGELVYRITPDAVRIESKCEGGRLVLPIIATALGKVRVEATTPVRAEKRFFNAVPGFEAEPLIIEPDADGKCCATISVRK